jgi:hypothetical protein
VVVFLSLVAMDSGESLFPDVSNDFLPTPSTCLLGAGLSNLPASSGSHPKHSRSVMACVMRSDCESPLNEDEGKK